MLNDGAGPGGQPSRFEALFRGPDGLRAGWSLLIFVAVGGAVTWAMIRGVLHFYHPPDGWTARSLIVAELISFLGAVAAVAVMAKIERRSFADYGFPWKRAFGGRFWEGALWGIATIGALVLAIAAAGGYTLSGLALHGAEALRSALLWGLAFLLVGLFEELFFRAYPLFTLARGIGFWPGALLLSLLFGALHYFTKPMETWLDALSVGLIGLFFCLTVRRTGDVWFAAGWHFAFNYGSMFACGSPNTGNDGLPIPGHLLAASFHGPQWLTGGPMGAEASALVFPVLAALFAGFLWRFREARFPAPG